MKHFVGYALLILTALLSSCATSSFYTPTSKLGQEAVQAMDKKHFCIDVREVVNHANNEIEYYLRSSIQVSGENAKICFDPRFTRSVFQNNNLIEDHHTVMTQQADDAEGNHIYHLSLHENPTNKDYIIKITLFKDSNRCCVQVMDATLAKEQFCFYGQVHD